MLWVFSCGVELDVSLRDVSSLLQLLAAGVEFVIGLTCFPGSDHDEGFRVSGS